MAQSSKCETTVCHGCKINHGPANVAELFHSDSGTKQ